MNVLFWVPILAWTYASYSRRFERHPYYYQLVHEAEVMAKYSNTPPVLIHDQIEGKYSVNVLWCGRDSIGERGYR